MLLLCCLLLHLLLQQLRVALTALGRRGTLQRRGSRARCWRGIWSSLRELCLRLLLLRLLWWLLLLRRLRRGWCSWQCGLMVEIDAEAVMREWVQMLHFDQRPVCHFARRGTWAIARTARTHQTLRHLGIRRWSDSCRRSAECHCSTVVHAQCAAHQTRGRFAFFGLHIVILIAERSALGWCGAAR